MEGECAATQCVHQCVHRVCGVDATSSAGHGPAHAQGRGRHRPASMDSSDQSVISQYHREHGTASDTRDNTRDSSRIKF